MAWSHFCDHYLDCPDLDFALDYSRVDLKQDFLASFEKKFALAHQAMVELEDGAIANPDEKRMVGHYWLRNPDLAPSEDIAKSIKGTLKKLKSFAQKVIKGKVKGTKGAFKNLLVIGIGGSALGPQFVEQALRRNKKGLDAFFFDNTDPDGMDRVLSKLKDELSKTLVVVISKSGGTKETRNGMLEAQKAFKLAKIKFSKHAVAVTGEGSQLYQTATSEGWLDIFPMWDWVGGRTSEVSAVGLLPAALSGFDVDGLLQGAAEMDKATRSPQLQNNPAGLLSALWYAVGDGVGSKDMVVLPYKDRLELFSKYLQQLVMESLGKKEDLSGKVVHQGLAVYGNKGSTDQHAYVQQLRDGLHNFFVTFIEVKKSRESKGSIKVDPGVTTGDYLEGFFLGTRTALSESGRDNITLTIGEVNARSVGQLIALFERAVGFYASYVNINAYHQPGVEAGKKAAAKVIEVKGQALGALKSLAGPVDAVAVAKAMGQEGEAETVFKLLNYLSANAGSGVECVQRSGPSSLFALKK